MFKKIIISLVIILSVLGCEQPTDEIIKEGTTINNILIIWKGSLSSAPTNPEIGWAYYSIVDKKSYVWDGNSWKIFAQDGISIIWKGELPSAPASPQLNWAYYNIIDGNSYIWNGSNWDLLAKAGRDGTSGILLWLGSLAAAPSNPSSGHAYYNNTQGISYIWDGDSWEILAQNGQDGINGTNGSNGTGIIWKGALSNNPLSPQTNWAYYDTSNNKSYIWDGDSWEVLTESGSSTVMVSISWKGSLTAAPSSPQIGWMYYNSLLGKTYIWDGSSWNIVSQDGQDGTSPEGFLIIWKGGLSSAPSNPQKGWAYYNTSQKKSYIWDGSTWQILAQDGQDGEGTVNPLPQIQFQISVNNTGYGEAYNGNQPISTIPFGNATVENSVSTSFFYIVNVGNSTLELTGIPTIKLSGNDADCFIIEQPSKTSLSAGERTSAKIIFSPTSLGEKTASVLIQNNTTGNPNYSFTITGNGITPTPSWYFSMSINGKSYTEIPYYYDMNPDTYSSYRIDTVDMGNIYLNESFFTSMSIMNYSSAASYALNSTLILSGDPAIQVSGANANLFVVTQPASTSISAGSSASAGIRFSPNSIGKKTATITILNNSMERPSFTFTIVGNVLPSRLWPKAFDGGEGDGEDAITCSLIDSSGNLYFIGYGFELVNDHSGSDWWIKKFNSTGNEITVNWNKKINLSTSPSSSYDRPSSAVIDSSNNIYISDGYYTLKFAPDGTEDMNWHKNVGGTLCIDTQDNIFILSSSTLRYFTSGGTEKWAVKNIPGFIMNMATTDSTGNVYIAGYGNNLIDTYNQNDAWIKKFDSAGNEITSGWNKILDWGHSDPERATRIFFDGTNIIVSGTGTDLINGYSANDGWFKKFSTAGSELSGFIIQDANSLLIRVDASGNYLISTNYNNTAISKYTATGQRLSQFSLGSTFYYNGNSKSSTISSLLFDNGNNLYIAGYSSNLLTDTSNTDWVIRKFNNMGIEQ